MSEYAVGSAGWFRELLDKLESEAGPDWANNLVENLTSPQRRRLLEALEGAEKD